MNTQDLISQLLSKTQNHLELATLLLEMSFDNLNQKKGENWSVLECVEHLNLYFCYYLPLIERKCSLSHQIASENFKSGILGSYFVNAVKPANEVKKMKTAKKMNPAGCRLDKTVIENFIRNLHHFAQLIEKSKQKNLHKVKIPVSFAKFLTVNLGDAFRFIVNHNERHLQQAIRTLKTKI